MNATDLRQIEQMNEIKLHQFLKTVHFFKLTITPDLPLV